MVKKELPFAWKLTNIRQILEIKSHFGVLKINTKQDSNRETLRDRSNETCRLGGNRLFLKNINFKSSQMIISKGQMQLL